MFSLYDNDLDSVSFASQPGAERVELVLIEGNSTDTKLSEHKLGYEELLAYFSQLENHDDNVSLRVILCPKRLDHHKPMPPFPLPRPIWETLAHRCGIPVNFPAFVTSSTAVVTEFSYRAHHFGALINQAWNSMAVSVDLQQRTINCFALGLCVHQVERLRYQLSAHQSFLDDPMLLPALWLENFTEVRARRAQGRNNAITQLRLRTGLHWSVEFNPDSLAQQGLTDLVYKLNMLGDELAWDEFALQTLTRGTEKIRDLRNRYLRGDAAADGALRAHSQLDMRLTNLQDVLRSLQEKTANTIRTTNIQLQTMYNFISQSDSQANIEHAAASRQLAQLSLQESAIMKSIALSSNEVAIMTRRDSTDMRMIAAVTLAFLPATWTATYFSTTFFNFQPSEQKSIVSSWTWLYWTVTVTLTMLVFGGWWLWSNRNGKKARTQLSKAELVTSIQSPNENPLSLVSKSFAPLPPSQNAHRPTSVNEGLIKRITDPLPASKVRGINDGVEGGTCNVCAYTLKP